jgi:hypothetical protein
MAAVLVVLAAGCGGDDRDAPAEAAKAKPKPAASADEFVDRFEKLTAVRLQTADDTFGTRIDEPDDEHLGYRLSGYSYYWTENVSDRELLLDGQPGPDDTRWDRAGDGWSVAKAYGPELIVSWVGADTKQATPEWERIDRLSEAAYTGDLSVLEPEERPCGTSSPKSGADPCSVDGIPVRAADGERLVTPVLEAEVTGMSTSDTIGLEGSPLEPEKASGTYVVVAYRLANPGAQPLRYLRTELRIGDETFPEEAGAGVYLPRSAAMPLAPGEELEAEVAFDVPTELASRARREGVLVMPADRDELGDPNIQFSQGWIRLAGAPNSLPEITAPAPPGTPPPPEGPPDIPLTRGDGPPIGGTARRLYMANSFFPLPEDFVAGGVRVGNRAGECVVPRVTARVRASLLAKLRRDTPRKDGRVPGLPDRQILLADCGAAGRWAIVSWVGKRATKGPVIFVDEFEARRGAWHGSPKGRWPGCGIPEAAAAAWQIDISHCAARDEGPGQSS